MAKTYGHDVRAEVVRRLAAGERLKHIARTPGMPCPESVTGWMRADPGFAAAVAAARETGAFMRRGFDEDKARRLLTRLGEGEPIGRILSDPDMPSPAIYYRHWLRGGRAPGWFHEERAAVVAAREAQRRLKVRRRRWRGFDPDVAEAIYVRLWKGEGLRAILRSDRRFPSLMVFARWRKENAEFDAQMRFVIGGMRRRRGREGTLCTPELTAEIVARIVEGHSFRSLARLPGMPSQRALSNWVRDRPEFAAAVAQACEDRADGFRDRMWEAVVQAGPLSRRKRQKLTAELSRQETRLRKRPGWRRARQSGSEQ